VEESMNQAIALTGMVLSAAPAGEYDKRIQILTKEKGKITAFARGARRPNSAFLAATNPFSFGRFEVYEGRSAYTLAKVSIRDYNRELAKDLESACYGFYFLEVAAWNTQENMDGTDFLNLLYVALRALLNPSLDNRLVRRVYELRALVISGEYPNVFSCMKCGSKEGLSFFSVERHGTLCGGCLGGEHVLPLNDSARYALQYIITAPLGKLYTFCLSKEAFSCVDEILDRYIAQFSSHAYQSLDMLKSLHPLEMGAIKW